MWVCCIFSWYLASWLSGSGPFVPCPPVPWSRGSRSFSNAVICSARESLKPAKAVIYSSSSVPRPANAVICSISHVPRWNCQRSKTRQCCKLQHWACSATRKLCNLQHLKHSNVASSSPGVAPVLWSSGPVVLWSSGPPFPWSAAFEALLNQQML